MLKIGYDIRGVYGEDIDEELAYNVGLLSARHGTVLIGHDARRGSVSLYRALADGVVDGGGVAALAGLVTTPVLAYAAKRIITDAAVMVTASHNPPEYNGFKLFGPSGLPLSTDGVMRFWRRVGTARQAEGGTLDRVDAWGLYVDGLSSIFPELDAIVALDAGNGVGSLYGDVLRNFAKVVPLRSDIHPEFPERGPEPKGELVHGLANVVRDGRADIVISTDGDGDRVVIVDELGAVPPHQLLHAFYRALGGPVVVSADVPPALLPDGPNVHRAPVGTSNIVSKALSVGARFSAEMSGHFTAYDFSYSSDPVYFGLLAAELDLRPQVPDVCHVSRSYRIVDPAAALAALRRHFPVVSEIDGIELDVFGNWVLVRPSNTEPKLRVSAAGPDPEGAIAAVESVILEKSRTSRAFQGARA